MRSEKILWIAFTQTLNQKSYLHFNEQIELILDIGDILLIFIWKAGVLEQLGTVNKWVPSSHITPTNQVGQKHLCGRG